MTMWKLQSLQAVWFMNSTPAITVASFYEKILQKQPLNFQTNSIGNMPGGTIAVASGDFDSRSFNVQIQPGRIDFTLTPEMPSGPSLPVSPPFFDEPDAVIDSVLPILERANLDDVGVVRLALLCQFAHSTKTLADANRVSLGRLNLPGDYGDVSDFNFQLNRLKPSDAVSGILLNRIVRWGTASFQFVQMGGAPFGGVGGMGGFGSPFGMQVPQVREAFAATATIDVNTQVGSDRVFSFSEQSAIFLECASEIKRLAAANSPEALL